MKLSLIAGMALAFSAGVTPAALAQVSETTSSATVPAQTSLAGLQPISQIDARYPYRELRNRSEGECTVVFDVMAGGETTNVRTRACSSRDFDREARRVAASLRYPADAAGLRDQSFTIRWEGEES